MPIAENLDDKIKKFWPKNGPATDEIDKHKVMIIRIFFIFLFYT